MNVAKGASEDKILATGLHRVRDIYCIQCTTIIGWTYVSDTNSFSKASRSYLDFDMTIIVITLKETGPKFRVIICK